MMVQLEDATGQTDQQNLPGTTHEHPNWQRRLPVPVEDVFQSPLALDIMTAMREARPRG